MSNQQRPVAEVLAEIGASGFHREFLGMPWTTSEGRKRLLELASQYIERTEAYDRTVCTGPIGRYGIMPATAKERSLIICNAATLLSEFSNYAKSLGFTAKELRRAIGEAEQGMSGVTTGA
jgi:hypothetical protein